jgi:hypothetical protein
MSNWLCGLWNTARLHDLPNWFAVGFTAILWPLAIFAWNHRTVNGVRGLVAHFEPGQILIDKVPYPAVAMRLANHTIVGGHFQARHLRSAR